MICRANQLTGFYMRGTVVVKGSTIFVKKLRHEFWQDPKYASDSNDPASVAAIITSVFWRPAVSESLVNSALPVRPSVCPPLTPFTRDWLITIFRMKFQLVHKSDGVYFSIKIFIMLTVGINRAIWAQINIFEFFS